MHAHVRDAGRLIVSVMAAALLSAGAAQAAKAPPKQVELYAMDCGKFPVPDADMFSDDGAYKGVSRTLIVPCYLIRHPKGDLVWDTGVPQSKQMLLDQLKQLDLTPADIEYVSVSHGHFDHIGNAGLFAGGTWIVDPDERAYVFSDNARKNAAQFAAYAALETSRQASIDKAAHDVFGDGSVVIHQTPGHTPGHTILQVTLKEAGTVLLTGDLWHLAESRAAKRVPRFNVDRAQTLKSYDLTEALAARTKARVVREHVMEDFEAMPKFPAALK
jgi:N-acyl homoserine lactone hydrolase